MGEGGAGPRGGGREVPARGAWSAAARAPAGARGSADAPPAPPHARARMRQLPGRCGGGGAAGERGAGRAACLAEGLDRLVAHEGLLDRREQLERLQQRRCVRRASHVLDKVAQLVRQRNQHLRRQESGSGRLVMARLGGLARAQGGVWVAAPLQRAGQRQRTSSSSSMDSFRKGISSLRCRGQGGTECAVGRGVATAGSVGRDGAMGQSKGRPEAVIAHRALNTQRHGDSGQSSNRVEAQLHVFILELVDEDGDWVEGVRHPALRPPAAQLVRAPGGLPPALAALERAPRSDSERRGKSSRRACVV